MRYEVRRVSLRSLALAGGVAGLLFSCLPALCLGSVTMSLVNRAAGVLVSMRGFQVQLPDLEAFGLSVKLPDIPVDLVSRLGLEELEVAVLALAGSGGLILVLLLLVGMVAGALGVALFALLWGAVYNLLAPRIGGLVVVLHPPDPLPSMMGLPSERGKN